MEKITFIGIQETLNLLTNADSITIINKKKSRSNLGSKKKLEGVAKKFVEGRGLNLVSLFLQ